jgi:acyl carrier protein|tara:strand:+ start:56 stop:355 length:300 start_codon:yes stop_codon:yes gene_type:complete
MGKAVREGAGVNHTGDKVSTDKADIILRIREAMTPFLAPGTAITEDMKIGSDIEIDSVDVFDVVMELEEFYDISLPMETTSEIQTIGELAGAVEQQLHV